MKEFKELDASSRLEERILKVTNELEHLEKIFETSSIVNKMVKDLETTSELLSELLEKLKTLKSHYVNLQKFG